MSAWPVTFSLPHGLIVGGVTTWTVQLADALAKAGRRTRLVVHGDESDPPPHLQPFTERSCGSEIVHAPPLNDPAGWQESVRVYRELLPSVLLPFALAENYAVAAALATVWPERVRVIGWTHSDNPYDYETLAYYESIIHGYVAISRRCETELCRRLPTRSDSVTYLPHGVEIPAVQTRLPLANRPIRLIYAGRIEQGGKRVLDFVTLSSKLDERGIRFELRLVGDGPQAGELRARIDAARRTYADPRNKMWLDPAVPHEQMPPNWCWADAALVISYREGFSLSMIESMACGCVPVVSRVESGVADILEEGGNGLTFPVGDLDALADAIVGLAGNEARAQRLAAAARETVQARCDYGRYVTRVGEILDATAAGAPRSWPVTRPLCMNAARTPGGPTVPADAEQRLRTVLRHISVTGAGPVAIYGAGSHTRALAAVWAEAPVDIVAVIDDDDGRHGGRLWGWPIVGPDAAAATGARSVVISSWMYESEIWERRRTPLEAAGLRVFGLYSRPVEGRAHE